MLVHLFIKYTSAKQLEIYLFHDLCVPRPQLRLKEPSAARPEPEDDDGEGEHSNPELPCSRSRTSGTLACGCLARRFRRLRPSGGRWRRRILTCAMILDHQWRIVSRCRVRLRSRSSSNARAWSSRHCASLLGLMSVQELTRTTGQLSYIMAPGKSRMIGIAPAIMAEKSLGFGSIPPP